MTVKEHTLHLVEDTPQVEKFHKKSKKNVKQQNDKKRQDIDRKRNRKFKRDYKA